MIGAHWLNPAWRYTRVADDSLDKFRERMKAYKDDVQRKEQSCTTLKMPTKLVKLGS